MRNVGASADQAANAAPADVIHARAIVRSQH